MTEKDPMLICLENVCDKMDQLNEISERLCNIFEKRNFSFESKAIKRAVQEFSNTSMALSKEMENFSKTCDKFAKTL